LGLGIHIDSGITQWLDRLGQERKILDSSLNHAIISHGLYEVLTDILGSTVPEQAYGLGVLQNSIA